MNRLVNKKDKAVCIFIILHFYLQNKQYMIQYNININLKLVKP